MKKSRVLKNLQNQITQNYGNGHSGIDLVGQGSKLDYIIACDDGYVIIAQSGRKNNLGSVGNESYRKYAKN